jgi:large subunit ribosomal protein L9
MKVILLDELKGRGGEGDVIEVATGYAVNFLLPRKIAIAATQGNLKQLEQRKHNIAKRESTRIDTADKLLAALEGQRVRLGAKVGEEGQLFGSVTPIQVAEALKAQLGLDIDRRRIDLHGIVKTVGEHSATISIYRDIKANISIEVVDENLLKAEQTDEAVESADGTESAETAEETTLLESVEEHLKDVAEVIAEAADAAESDPNATAESKAEAAVEVLRNIEGTLDAAVADAVVAEIEKELPEGETESPETTE